MTLILSGTDGVSDVDGTAATPAVRGSDTNTGIFFPAADTIAFAISGTERVRINSLGYVTMPSQPVSSRRMATNLSADQLIAWPDSLTETGISYNTGTRRFTVPVTGRYLISFSGFKLDSAGATRIILGVNTDAPNAGTGLGMIYTNNISIWTPLSFQVILSLSANDFFVFRLLEGTLYANAGDRFNYMTAQLIG